MELYPTRSKIRLCEFVGNKPLCTRNLQGKCTTLGTEHVGPQDSLVSKLQESKMLKTEGLPFSFRFSKVSHHMKYGKK
jgi:hypothetical protein